ncbi:hypothetical protein JL100_018125 [Skermanella mucosa]|uniref:hypothetical protein n=1 Tax=Skermanella mucosa TaxID=1789672 RepID=UPI00192BC6CB|nr:hypothetical protein [Skermanella mucosa]UEM19004.1 hypothetical protein JL100_018125 [Skermanella mucosa]
MPERRYHASSSGLPPSLAFLVQGGVTDLLAVCRDCHNTAYLPVETVIQRLGPDRLVPQVKARCSICGSRDCDIRPDFSGSCPGVITRHGAAPLR